LTKESKKKASQTAPLSFPVVNSIDLINSITTMPKLLFPTVTISLLPPLLSPHYCHHTPPQTVEPAHYWKEANITLIPNRLDVGTIRGGLAKEFGS
jgi:hypothetical protein